MTTSVGSFESETEIGSRVTGIVQLRSNRGIVETTPLPAIVSRTGMLGTGAKAADPRGANNGSRTAAERQSFSYAAAAHP